MIVPKLSRRTFTALMLGAAGTSLIRTTQARAAVPGTHGAQGVGSHVDTIEHPTGADELIVRVSVEGGFVPLDYQFTAMPHFSLYGDGRAIIQGPQILIYPGPALPNLLVTRLTDEGIQMVLQAAREAGLMAGDQDYANDQIADAGTTVFTVNADGQTNVVTAYALELSDEQVSPEEREARQKLQDFMGFVTSIPVSLPDSAIAEPEQAYEIERLQVVSQPATAALEVDDPSLVQEPMTWPLDIPLATFGEPLTRFEAVLTEPRCGVVDDDEAENLVAALMEANTLTPWESEGDTYVLYVRPLLPDEDGCADLVETVATPPA